MIYIDNIMLCCFNLKGTDIITPHYTTCACVLSPPFFHRFAGVNTHRGLCHDQTFLLSFAAVYGLIT